MKSQRPPRTLLAAAMLAAASLGVVCEASAQVTRQAGPPESWVRCEGQEDPSLSGLAGFVRDSVDQFAVPGATIIAVWDTGQGRMSLTAESDDQGIYKLCGLPVSRPISIRAAFAGYASQPVTVTIEPGLPAGWDFAVPVEEGTVRGDERFPGRIVGRVRDRETGRPVEAASIELIGEDRGGLSDGNGRYAFDALTPGPYRVAVQHLAFETVERIVEVPGNRTLEVNFDLSADPIELEPLVVTAIRVKRLENRGFYERREMGELIGNGVFLDSEAIRRMASTRVTSILGQLPGVRIDCGGGLRSSGCTVRMTAGQPSLSSSGTAGCTNSNVYIDGARVLRENQTMPMGIDELILPSEIVGMEVYRGPSEVPAEFGGSVGRCGAIVIWTGSGGG